MDQVDSQLTVEEQLKKLQTENEILKAQNEILMSAINNASFLMASVPFWNNNAREVAGILSDIKKQLD